MRLPIYGFLASARLTPKSIIRRMLRKPHVLYGFLRPVLRKPYVSRGFLKPNKIKHSILHKFVKK